MKILARIILLFLFLVVIIAAVGYLSIDGIIKSQVQTRATAALGVQTLLQNANLNVFGGTLTLNGLAVANPPGFPGPYLLTMGTGTITVNTGTLLSSTIQIPEIYLDNVQINVDQSGLSSNLGDVLANANKYSAASGATNKSGKPSPTAKSSGGRRLAIGEIVIPKCAVTLQMAVAKGTPGAAVTFNLHQIVIKKPLDANGRPLRLADLTTVIVGQIAQQIAQNPHLPSALGNAIGNSSNVILRGIGNVLKSGGNAATPLGKAMGNTLNKLFHSGGSAK